MNKKFKISKYFPKRDINKFKKLAKEGIHLYPLLWSNNKDDIDYAVGILQSNNIKLYNFIQAEMDSENPAIPDRLEDFEEYFYKNGIELLLESEYKESAKYDIYNRYFDSDKDNYCNPHRNHMICAYSDESVGFNCIPIVFLKYIRYIQQDGKI